MAVTCPKCGRQYDITLFQFDRTIRCVCGARIDASHVSPFREIERLLDTLEDREKARELQLKADAVCRQILDPRIPEVDVRIAEERLREMCRELFPDRLDLFDMIYGSRFRRLWEQFRK